MGYREENPGQLEVLCHDFAIHQDGSIFPTKGDPDFVSGDVFLWLGRSWDGDGTYRNRILIGGKVLLVSDNDLYYTDIYV